MKKHVMFLLIVALIAMGCSSEQRAQKELEIAEKQYKDLSYGDALYHYQIIIQNYPNTSQVTIAKTRI